MTPSAGLVEGMGSLSLIEYDQPRLLPPYQLPSPSLHLALDEGRCQEIGLVALMFFFEPLFSYVSSSISFYVSLTNLFSIICFPYLLITRDTQDEGEARFRFY